MSKALASKALELTAQVLNGQRVSAVKGPATVQSKKKRGGPGKDISQQQSKHLSLKQQSQALHGIRQALADYRREHRYKQQQKQWAQSAAERQKAYLKSREARGVRKAMSAILRDLESQKRREDPSADVRKQEEEEYAKHSVFAGLDLSRGLPSLGMAKTKKRGKGKKGKKSARK
eukprot:m.30928 g.30928  ORF g.30928 m.30928 type:complete len:175 (+) comp9351_c0_seq1:233-757(+)